ncbi:MULTISPECIES: NAD-dependent succinate-semialdehyde dehydrogenase [unclassified Flavobacterium]|uniref:NAD-dependent succinate-semialdehyde dehydrogenase n=1 Tax=unclassified Flavobacterium TaxID=196869 RepID=UPI003F93D090
MKLNNPKLLRDKAFINGQWVAANSQLTFEVKNPFNNEVIANVADCSAIEVQKAIEKANTAFIDWKKTSATERAGLLRKWFDLQIEHAEDLGKILTWEQGKPLQEAIGEIKYGASFVEWFSEEARRGYGDVIPGHQRDKRIITLKQPIGVVALITPWNFPNAMITRKVAPALAAGCTVVIKPPKLTPLSALALAVLAEEAGIPAGVINIVTGSDSSLIGKELCKSTIVKKLSFTGSTAVGKILLAQCAATVKKVSMELGGNAPFIVFEDADIDAAVEGAMISKYRNAGQTCVCTNRFYVQESVYGSFVKKLTARVKEMKIGNGFEKDVIIGPLIEEKAVAFVEEIVKDARSKGANLVIGGKRIPDSLVFEPTILTNVNKDMLLFHEEIFGPVASIFKFKTEEEVIDQANDTPFGLASYFYGRDYAKIWRVAEALEYGMVGINTGLISTTVAPFGGIKESGFGREGSKYGMEDYQEIKYLCFGGVE